VFVVLFGVDFVEVVVGVCDDSDVFG